VRRQSRRQHERWHRPRIRPAPRCTATMVKINGKWLIAAFHNTLTSGPGYSWGSPPTSQQEKPTAESDHQLVGCPDSLTAGRRPPDGLRNYRSQDFHCFAQGSHRTAVGKLPDDRSGAKFCYSSQRCCRGGWKSLAAHIGITNCPLLGITLSRCDSLSRLIRFRSARISTAE